MSRLYYAHAFPYETVHALFSRGWQADGPGADKREYGIETHPEGKYRRWMDCERAIDLHAFVQHPQFGKLNVGAMMDKRPSLRWKCPSGSEPKPVQREFVVDFDLGDYEYLGVSKNDVTANDEAFGVVGVAMEVWMDVLRNQYGFEHVLPVYSGRRGGHLWVCDKRACFMNDGARKAIVDFMKPGQKTHESGRKTFKWLLQYPTFGSPDNPMQKQGLFSRIVYKFFRGVGVKPKARGGLGLLDAGFDRTAFLKMIDDRLAKDQEVAVRSAPSGMSALLIIEQVLRQKPKEVKAWLVPRFCEAICTMVWPRADEAVSTHMNHTLKAPFSVHPGTGRVSVPILGREQLWEFDPSIEAPMASDEMPASFHRSIQQTNAFIDQLAKSATETWQPPDLSTLDPPPKRMCVERTIGTSSDDTPLLSDTTRVAWVTERLLSVYVDDEGLAHFEMATYPAGNVASIVIKARQFPPFQHTGTMMRPGPDEHQLMLEHTLNAVEAATADCNTSYHAYSWQQIVVVDPDVQDELASLRRADYRLARIRARLAEGVVIGSARIAWGGVALRRYVSDELWPMVEAFRSI